MKPVISVIIATFNAESTLKDCLDSIIKQKNSLIELIVIDGDSTDSTQTIISSYRFNIDYSISEKDRGIYDAWNKGISHVHGDWILFIGADDTLEPDAFDKYIKFLNLHDTTGVDYICAKNTYLSKEGKILKEIGVPWRWEQFRKTMKVAHVASLHRVTLFKEIGLYDLKFPICGDYELLLRKQDKLRCLFFNNCIARMTTGGASFSMKALWEAHKIRRLHSGHSILILTIIYIWQMLIFQRHKLLN